MEKRRLMTGVLQIGNLIRNYVGVRKEKAFYLIYPCYSPVQKFQIVGEAVSWPVTQVPRKHAAFVDE